MALDGVQDGIRVCSNLHPVCMRVGQCPPHSSLLANPARSGVQHGRLDHRPVPFPPNTHSLFAATAARLLTGCPA